MTSPASSESREQDAAAVRSLLAQAGTLPRGAVRLPAMSAAELCVLGALKHPLIDAETLSWWTSRTDEEELTRMTREFLARRGLVDRATGRFAPALGLILAGRTRPAFIALERDQPDADAERLRMYGIGERPGGLRAVLVEEARPGAVEWAGPAYTYGLASAESGGHALAGWVAAGTRRTIDFYLPGAGKKIPSERIVVSPRPPGLLVQRYSPDAPESGPLPCDEDALTALLRGIMTGACR